MRRITIILSLLLLTLAERVAAQGLSNKGKEFWTGYGLHQFMEMPWGDNSQEMVLYFSAERPANVTVTVRGRTANLVKTYPVPANSVIVTAPMPKDGGSTDCRLYDLPPTFGGNGGDGLFHVSIHIESDVPIVAYAHIYGSLSSGATMLMPVETWGYAYTSLNSRQEFEDDCFSFCYVVAQHDSTLVAITPSVPTRDGNLPGVTYYATLDRGDIYQVVGAGMGMGLGYELTGTTVRSIANAKGNCYPIAFFSGSSRTRNACSGGVLGGDNDMQQAFPYETWGRRYLTAPTSSTISPSTFMTNIYKVVVRDPATVVKRNQSILSNFDPASMSYTFESDKADYIEADKPVLVAQFISGGCLAGGLGDPEMIYLSPVEQRTNRIGFYRNTEESIEQNFLTLIIPKKGFPSLRIDGGTGFSYTYTHPQDTNYMVVVKQWPAAKAQCIVQSDSAFTAVTYGLGYAESYGYNAGTEINNLNAVLNVHNIADATVKSHPFTCRNTPMEFSLLMLYQPTKLVWQISQLPGVTPHTDITQTNPSPSETVVINNITYYRYTLAGAYQFDTTGIFGLPITAAHPFIENCKHEETIITAVTVKALPTASFTYQHTGCMADSVYLAADSAAVGYAVSQWKWTFDDGTTAGKDSVAKRFTTTGTHPVTLTVQSAEGCIADTTINVTLFAAPLIGVSVSDPAVCAGSAVRFGATTPGSNVAVKDWYWDFGNNATATGTTPGAITYQEAGIYKVKLVGKASAACISDTVRQDIRVYANPVPSFTYPAGCLPANGVVAFTSTATTSDAQSITGHQWHFGDAAGSSPSNPDMATTANASHLYAQYGAYTITYQVTTANGCMADTAVNATFSRRPVLAYTTPPAVCQGIPGTVSVAAASVTNGVAGTGIYKGMAIDAAGMLTPAQATPGTHTVTYVFTSADGCTDSISRPLVIAPRPRASFTTAANICDKETAQLTDASSVTPGSIATWNWDYGDGTRAIYNSAVPFSKQYTRPGTYVVKLSVASDKNCISNDTSQTITVQPLPVADFTLPSSVCMPEGKAVFTNTSTIAGNTALTYEWDFGDGSAVSAVASPAHNYLTAGNYPVRLTATSTYGCVASKHQSLTAFYDQPVADFTVTPETLCQGADNRFTDASTAPGSTVAGWNWSFADGTSSAQRNPTKQYAHDGHYTIRLTVTNAAGCTSQVAAKDVVVYVQPVIDAGPSLAVPEGALVTLQPTVNDSVKVTFQWSPAADLNNAALLRPAYIALEDKTFTLTATGLEGGCVATDVMTVRVQKTVNVPNIFTPNGDGIHDTWEITHLDAYPGCTVTVFNRYGQQVYTSAGYAVAWKGTVNGKVLPAGTYYYIIDLKNGSGKLTGSVTLLQ